MYRGDWVAIIFVLCVFGMCIWGGYQKETTPLPKQEMYIRIIFEKNWMDPQLGGVAEAMTQDGTPTWTIRLPVTNPGGDLVDAKKEWLF